MNNIIKQNVSDRIVLGKSIINQAGLGSEIEIIIQEGIILILPSIKPKGWKVWRTLGEDAREGVLKNPSENHDQYLYGAEK